MAQIKIDLHTHSTASDGLLTPSQLVRYAKSKGLTHISLTDHDTLDGLDEAIAESNSIKGIEVIPGVELSVEGYPGELHILGYYLNHHDRKIRSILSEFKKARVERAKKIIIKLRNTGLNIGYEEVQILAKGTVGRAHIARVMVKKGFVESVEEAFNRYLSKGKPAYVPKKTLSLEKSIKLILDAGGIPVLAHPITLKLDTSEFIGLLNTMISYGLRGIEVYSARHTQEDIRKYLVISEKYGLIATGGSDFHGKGIMNIDLGCLDIPEKVLWDLKSELRRTRKL